MNKQEMASYLVSLHSLIEAQTKGSHSVASVTLGAEYEKYWGLLKAEIAKEHEDETRRRKHIEDGRNQARNNLPHSEPGRGSADRQSDEPRLFSEAGNVRDGGSGPR